MCLLFGGTSTRITPLLFAPFTRMLKMPWILKDAVASISHLFSRLLPAHGWPAWSLRAKLLLANGGVATYALKKASEQDNGSGDVDDPYDPDADSFREAA